MWPLRELTAGLKEFAFHEVRNWIKTVGDILIWAISFVLIGSLLEFSLADEFQQIGLLVTLVAATAVTYLVTSLKTVVLMSVD
ncbi:hypothetical protein [Halorubrum lipolyticum]|uniref:Uncharacterized protein n=1 Tax=Halorubrum lipolyticum DSM 21995 TaxID=1227482 RepID=M0NQW0_9EURY|nr:hypothetical protein [Halorubrum lipolyticum]EMA59594.1 hypothetical protein C469_09731 [Halorubrum lipolyticum DSM 21995]